MESLVTSAFVYILSLIRLSLSSSWFSRQPKPPKWVIYENSKIKIHGYLWLIDEHFWLNQARSANINIYDCHSISIAMIDCFVYKVIEANG